MLYHVYKLKIYSNVLILNFIEYFVFVCVCVVAERACIFTPFNLLLCQLKIFPKFFARNILHSSNSLMLSYSISLA